MVKFTEGPYTYDSPTFIYNGETYPTDINIYGADGEMVACLWNDCMPGRVLRNQEESAANARLFAAALELYSSLIEIVAYITVGPQCCTTERLEEIVGNARKVIDEVESEDIGG